MKDWAVEVGSPLHGGFLPLNGLYWKIIQKLMLWGQPHGLDTTMFFFLLTIVFIVGY